MSHRDDAGLRAVARVRGVRETDSRLGLQQALGELRTAQSQVDDLRRRIADADTFTRGSVASFLALRSSLDVLGGVLVGAEQERDQASTISASAQERWQQDRTRLAAIEMLLDRRAAVRRAERLRAEARDADEIAVQRWARTAAEQEEGR